MSTRLVIEGNAVYEIDEDCQAMRKKFEEERSVSGSCARPAKDGSLKKQRVKPQKA